LQCITIIHIEDGFCSDILYKASHVCFHSYFPRKHQRVYMESYCWLLEPVGFILRVCGLSSQFWPTYHSHRGVW